MNCPPGPNSKSIAYRTIGALAYDIRSCYGDRTFMRERIELIVRLASEYDVKIPEIKMEEAMLDGRYFRWSGPYAETVTLEELESIGLTPKIFEIPEDAVDDYSSVCRLCGK